nr:uncharacterized protein LOC123284635 isoform X1 [Equus asinus]
METWSWQWLSSLRRMPRPLSRRRQLTTKPCFLAVIDTSVWEAKQMREKNSICPPERDVLQLSNQRMDQKIRGIWGHRGSLRIHGLHLENCYCGGKPTGFNRRLKFEVSPPFFILMMIYFISHNDYNEKKLVFNMSQIQINERNTKLVQNTQKQNPNHTKIRCD